MVRDFGNFSSNSVFNTFMQEFENEGFTGKPLTFPPSHEHTQINPAHASWPESPITNDIPPQLTSHISQETQSLRTSLKNGIGHDAVPSPTAPISETQRKVSIEKHVMLARQARLTPHQTVRQIASLARIENWGDDSLTIRHLPPNLRLPYLLEVSRFQNLASDGWLPMAVLEHLPLFQTQKDEESANKASAASLRKDISRLADFMGQLQRADGQPKAQAKVLKQMKQFVLKLPDHKAALRFAGLTAIASQFEIFKGTKTQAVDVLNDVLNTLSSDSSQPQNGRVDTVSEMLHGGIKFANKPATVKSMIDTWRTQMLDGHLNANQRHQLTMTLIAQLPHMNTPSRTMVFSSNPQAQVLKYLDRLLHHQPLKKGAPLQPEISENHRIEMIAALAQIDHQLGVSKHNPNQVLSPSIRTHVQHMVDMELESGTGGMLQRVRADHFMARLPIWESVFKNISNQSPDRQRNLLNCFAKMWQEGDVSSVKNEKLKLYMDALKWLTNRKNTLPDLENPLLSSELPAYFDVTMHRTVEGLSVLGYEERHFKDEKRSWSSLTQKHEKALSVLENNPAIHQAISKEFSNTLEHSLEFSIPNEELRQKVIKYISNSLGFRLKNLITMAMASPSRYVELPELSPEELETLTEDEKVLMQKEHQDAREAGTQNVNFTDRILASQEAPLPTNLLAEIVEAAERDCKKFAEAWAVGYRKFIEGASDLKRPKEVNNALEPVLLALAQHISSMDAFAAGQARKTLNIYLNLVDKEDRPDLDFATFQAIDVALHGANAGFSDAEVIAVQKDRYQKWCGKSVDLSKRADETEKDVTVPAEITYSEAILLDAIELNEEAQRMSELGVGSSNT